MTTIRSVRRRNEQSSRRVSSLPSLVIGGAPKCATSELFRLLASHPEISASTPKETFYLVDSDYPIQPRGTGFQTRQWRDFGHFFPPESDQPRRRIEGTTHTLYQHTARRALADVPDCTVCFVLREPAQRMHSSFVYAQQNKTHIRPSLSFNDYVNHLLSGKMQRIRGQFTSPQIFRIFDRELSNSTYVDHLKEWLRCIGEQRLLILEFSDVVRDRQRTLTVLTDRLQISPISWLDQLHQSHNPTLPVRWWLAHRIASRAAALLPRRARIRGRLHGWYRRLQGRGPRRVDERDEAALQRLRDHFSGANARLESEFGIRFDTGSVDTALRQPGAADSKTTR